MSGYRQYDPTALQRKLKLGEAALSAARGKGVDNNAQAQTPYNPTALLGSSMTAEANAASGAGAPARRPGGIVGAAQYLGASAPAATQESTPEQRIMAGRRGGQLPPGTVASAPVSVPEPIQTDQYGIDASGRSAAQRIAAGSPTMAPSERAMQNATPSLAQAPRRELDYSSPLSVLPVAASVIPGFQGLAQPAVPFVANTKASENVGKALGQFGSELWTGAQALNRQLAPPGTQFPDAAPSQAAPARSVAAQAPSQSVSSTTQPAAQQEVTRERDLPALPAGTGQLTQNGVTTDYSKEDLQKLSDRLPTIPSSYFTNPSDASLYNELTGGAGYSGMNPLTKAKQQYASEVALANARREAALNGGGSGGSLQDASFANSSSTSDFARKAEDAIRQGKRRTAAAYTDLLNVTQQNQPGVAGLPREQRSSPAQDALAMAQMQKLGAEAGLANARSGVAQTDAAKNKLLIDAQAEYDAATTPEAKGVAAVKIERLTGNYAPQQRPGPSATVSPDKQLAALQQTIQNGDPESPTVKLATQRYFELIESARQAEMRAAGMLRGTP